VYTRASCIVHVRMCVCLHVSREMRGSKRERDTYIYIERERARGEGDGGREGDRVHLPPVVVRVMEWRRRWQDGCGGEDSFWEPAW